MALFGLGKKKDDEQNVSSQLPVDKVIQMRQQGFSNNQIVETLQREGYSTTKIFDAMSQAELSAGQQPAQPAQPQPQQQPAYAEQYPQAVEKYAEREYVCRFFRN